MPQFFIDRPVFAWVVAILIALGGLLALMRLPAEAYPEIAPPQVAVSTTYPGASAATVETTVTQVIEQQLTGLDNLLYFTSQSASDGSAAIVLTFATGTNADIAAVQTQNRVTLAQPRLPAEVNQQGIRIAKVSAGFLGAIGLRSAAGGPGAFPHARAVREHPAAHRAERRLGAAAGRGARHPRRGAVRLRDAHRRDARGRIRHPAGPQRQRARCREGGGSEDEQHRAELP